MEKNTLSENTVIEIGKSISLSKFQAFFREATGEELSGWEFGPWLNTQVGKALGEAVDSYRRAVKRKSMEEILTEDRFSLIRESDKAFIRAFDVGIMRLGYDFGGGIGDGYCWGKYMIVYSKTGAKSKKVVARIFIRENGIVLRLFFNNIDKHRTYIENAPEYIKDVFTSSHGNCSCNPKKENCKMRKIYTIDGSIHEKCSGVVFEFNEPTLERCPDYISLLTEFYPPKKSAKT